MQIHLVESLQIRIYQTCVKLHLVESLQIRIYQTCSKLHNLCVAPNQVSSRHGNIDGQGKLSHSHFQSPKLSMCANGHAVAGITLFH